MNDRMKMKLVRLGLIVLVALFFGACSNPTYRVFYKPIKFDEERRTLTLTYMEDHYGMVQEEPSIVPKMVVLHWTAIPNLERSYDAMNPVHLPGSRRGIASAGSLNVSSHYLIDRDGTIFRQLPDTIMARHVIGLNHCAIGVENVGSAKAPLTKAQLLANEELVRHLKRKYDIEYVIGHYEYTAFEGHPLWKELDEGYRTVKTDPGEKFMRKIRKRLEDLELKESPSLKKE
ncbi:N-acetylmuramoyl-L-alanine amidase [Echinicola salinicaeni]|uniref:N-acetylmuramoyl-L-alanine amidase n=1 Tax=Echinicola salinicaeni TaxID=2762757 RepID=UPI001E34C5D8|nr:peptidoglycan recognition family protein [Echinicola salinicaeni]